MSNLPESPPLSDPIDHLAELSELPEAEAAPWRRGFWAMMATQFQNAFSDNVLKQLVILLVLASSMSEGAKDSLTTQAAACFALPFILLSMFGGWLADHFPKRNVMVGVKTAEIAIMAFAAWALGSGHIGLQLAAICLMGVHSAIFGPSKYGSLPEIVPPSRLSWANGWLEMLTFVGIVGGMLFAGWLAAWFPGRQEYSGYVLTGLAVLGWSVSFFITKRPAADPQKKLRLNFVGELWKELVKMRPQRDLWRANWGNTAFNFVAAMVQINLLLYGKHVYNLNEISNSYVLAALALGIGAGSILAGQLSRGRIEYGFLPIGAALMVVMSLIMGWPGCPLWLFAASLALLGLGGGLYIVPVAAVLQHLPTPETKGAVQGAANLCGWIGVLAAAGVQGFLRSMGMPHNQIFWVCGLVSAVVGFYAWSTRPQALPALIHRWRGAKA